MTLLEYYQAVKEIAGTSPFTADVEMRGNRSDGDGVVFRVYITVFGLTDDCATPEEAVEKARLMVNGPDDVVPSLDGAASFELPTSL